MVLVLGVVAEESGDNTFSHSMVDYCELEEVREDNEEVREDNEEVRQSEKVRERKKECEMLRKADKWFYVLLFSADITLVLSVIVLFALFADWILFTAMVSNNHQGRRKIDNWGGGGGGGAHIHIFVFCLSSSF